jgi:hypothetical protein
MLRLFLAATLTLTTALAVPVAARDKGCPPGLAKKDPPCVPPGLAKKQRGGENDDWRVGDRVLGDYVLIPREDWERLRLRDYDDGSTYLRVDDDILRVVRDTLIVLEAVKIVGNLLN